MEKRTDSPYPRQRPARAGARRRGCWSSPPCSSPGATAQHDWRYYQCAVPQAGGGEARRREGGDRPGRRPADLGRRPGARRPLHHAATRRSRGRASRRPRSRTARTRRSRCSDHPVEKFGCTSCHGGQGWAIDTEAAHGQVAHWEEPLLGSGARRGLLARRRQERAAADELQRLPPLRPRDRGRRQRSTWRKRLVQREGLPRLPRDQRPRRHHRPRPDPGRRQGPGAVRLRPAVRPEDRLRLARGALQGPARPRRRHGDAELPLHHRAGAGAGDAGAFLAATWTCRRRTSPARRAPTRRLPRRRRPRSA